MYFSAAYTESIYLLGSVAVFYHLNRGEWRAGAGWGLMMGLARPNGFMLAAPMGLLVLERAWRKRAFSTGELIAAISPVVGVLLFMAYLDFRVGDPMAWVKGQAAWGRGYGGFFRTLTGFTDRTGELYRSGLYRYR